MTFGQSLLARLVASTAPVLGGRRADRKASSAGELRPTAKAYIAALSLTVAAVTVVTLARGGAPTTEQAVLATLFGVLVAVAWLFPVPFAFKTDLYLDTSVLLAALLVLEPGQAILLAGAGTVVAQAIRRRDALETLFNAVQVMLEAAVGAGVLALGGWQPGEWAFDQPGPVAATVIAALAMAVTSDLAVATMVALQSGRAPARTWLATSLRQTDWGDGLAQVAQIGLGLMAAILIEASPWTVVLLLPPAAAVYVSLAAARAQRRRAEEALRHTEDALAEAERVAHLGSWGWNLATGAFAWSDETYHLFGLTPGRIRPTWETFLGVVHPEDRAVVDRAVHEALAEGRSFGLEHRILREDGSQRLVFAQGEVVFDAHGERRRLVGTVHDVTERKALEARLVDEAQRAAALEERQRIARELHDSVSQALYGIGLGASAARSWLETDPRQAAEPLDYVLELVQAGLSEMRALILELRPEALEREGLVVALEKQAASLRARHGLAVETVLGDEPEISLPAKEALYRVAHEALHNAVKHAKPSRVVVRLEHGPRGIALEVTDDGVGFDPTSAFPGHFGLRSMRERLEQVNGTLEVASAPARGTRLRAAIPADAGAQVVLPHGV